MLVDFSCGRRDRSPCCHEEFTERSPYFVAHHACDATRHFACTGRTNLTRSLFRICCLPEVGPMRSRQILLFTAVVVSLATSAFAQATSSLRGKITDASNAAIPGASVSLVNEQTNFSRTVVSDET